jgi:hypothetical protein
MNMGVKMNNLATCSGFPHIHIWGRVERMGYADEHVLTYSGTLPQVPYNQHLKLGLRLVVTG